MLCCIVHGKSAKLSLHCLKMFFAPALLAAFAATAAIASPLRRAGALTVSVAAPAANVTSVEDLKLVAEVTNTGAEDLKVFKYGTVLDNALPTKSFVVTKDGETVAFQGIRVRSIRSISYIQLIRCYRSLSPSTMLPIRTTSSSLLVRPRLSSMIVSLSVSTSMMSITA